MERVGRALLGSVARFQLGIWIAGLPGRPRTFGTLEYWSFCEDAGWPGAGRPIGYHMARFELLGMVEVRHDLRPRPRRQQYTRLDSAGWDLFASLDPWRRAHQPKMKLSELHARIARADLVQLRAELNGRSRRVDNPVENW
jgi:hypothetical protein